MNTLSGAMIFSPDLIVEVTSVCDRSCNGCYAPNVVSRAGAKELQKFAPNLFLSAESLELGLEALEGEKGSQPIVISFRGGEPSRNPFLAELLQVAARRSPRIFVETHGRWVIDPIPGEEMENRRLIESIRNTHAIVKVSFDRMHGLSQEKLQAITDTLDREQIEWCIAITEATENAFMQTRSLCSWVPNDKVICQPKATSVTALIRPRLGVIRSDGSMTGQLSVRDSLGRAISADTSSPYLFEERPA
jgi:organic radical activating enzyme